MFKKLRKNKYLSHSYDYEVIGEHLPDKKLNKKALALSLVTMLFLFALINFVCTSFFKLIRSFKELENPTLFNILNVDWNASFELTNLVTPVLSFPVYSILFLIAMVLAALLYFRIDYKSEKNIAFGQKGDSRFTTIKEIQEQYVEIPEVGESFKGVGGVPISHYKDKYYIDTDTANTCILGVSRSGKGEIIITTMMDILSRAEEKSSMIINDPKGELFAGAKETLEKRGYDVQVLNLQDPMQSMSYNPLQLVIEAWLQGNEQEAAKRANSIAFSLYNDPNAGENAFFNDGAQNAVTAIILALVEYCINNNQTEKITMYNVAEMLNELGTLYYKENEDDFVEKNALDEFFMNLPQGHVAKKRYGSTSFAGEKTRGSILSTANQGLQPFVDPLFAKMTSTNSIDLKQVGFPKYLFGQLDHSFLNKRIEISFHKNNQEKTLIGKYRVKIKEQGMYYLNFKEKLENGDLVLIKYKTDRENYKIIYKIQFEKEIDSEGNVIYQKKEGSETLPELKREVKIHELYNNFPVVNNILQMKYSDKPTAVFMIIPDYDSSNHTLASIYTKQLYTELASNCSETKGKKCFQRVQFIMDEFGNMPPIDDMDQVMTVCLGRNIIFNLVVQSYSQIKRKYGEAAEAIKENCQNHIYIMSTNDETIEELSRKAGHKTVMQHSSSESYMKIDNQISKSAEQERLITFDRLSQLIEGETLVIRSLHRQSLDRRKVRPYPIFNTRETNMPYRYQFLQKWIDTSKDLNEIDISSQHSNLNLDTLKVNFADFIMDKGARQKYNRSSSVRKDSETIVPPADKVQQENFSDFKINTVLQSIENLLKDEENEEVIYQVRELITGYRLNNELPSRQELQALTDFVENQELVRKIRTLISLKNEDDFKMIL